MLKYINLPIELLQFSMRESQKILLGILITMTRKGETITTASNAYLGDVMGGKSEQQISRMLSQLKARKMVAMSRGLGRRQISLNKKGLLEAGLMTELRKAKNGRKK